MTVDKGSFPEIYGKHYPGILRFLTRLVGEVEAEDGNSAIGTWIYAIARNAALDRLRARSGWDRSAGKIEAQSTDDAPVDICSTLPDERASVEQNLIGKEMGECIRGRVESLPESYRSVLVMSELAGMTYRDERDELACEPRSVLG